MRQQKESGAIDVKVVDACLENYAKLEDLWHSYAF